LYASAGWRKQRICFGQNVVDVPGFTGRKNMLVQWFIGDRERDNRSWDRTDMGHEAEHVAVNQAHRNILCAAQARSALNDRIEHSLEVSW
jgi:hypothetical protein